MFTVQARKKKETCGIAKPVSEVSISSAESVEKTAEESKATSSRLQSPIESHFAVTPTVDSKNSSPANGFTNVDCGELLCEELDNLAINDPTKFKGSVTSIDELVPIHSSSTSFEELEPKTHSEDKCMSKEPISIPDDIAPVHSVAMKENTEKVEKEVNQLNDLMSPVEESISMFTQLTDKLSEMTAAEGDSGVETAHNISDDETCKAEVNYNSLDIILYFTNIF